MATGFMTRQEVSGLIEKLAASSAASGPRAALPSGREMANQELRKLAAFIDHTLLRPDTTQIHVERLCHEALRSGFAVACVNPVWVPQAARILHGSGVRVGSVAGFPLGASTTMQKRAEAWAAICAGAQEIDMVMNIGAMKSGDLGRVEHDIQGVAEVCREGGAVLKVILENAYLTNEEKIAACRLAEKAGADFVKTSTGFGPSGATPADVRLMRQSVSPAVGVKAAGGIRTLADAMRLLEAGANRLGTSAGVAILEEAASLLV